VKRVLSILLVLIVLASFAATLFYLYAKSKTAPTVWDTAEPVVTTIVKKAVATGAVVPRKEVAIKPQVSGILERLLVEPGRLVRQGELVARIRIVPDLVTLNAAESRLSRARLSLADADWQLERHVRLAADGVVTDAALRAARLAADNAREELAAAESNLELIRQGSTARGGEASNTLVRATVSGMVLEVPVEEGASVIEVNTFNEGTTIAVVADMDDLVFKGKVDESEVGRIRPGMTLILTIGALEAERFEATLEHIAPKGVEENAAVQFEIRAAVKPRAGLLVRANLSANADIVLDRRDEVLALDEGLVQFEGDQAWVEVETAPQIFERRRVETGLSDGIHVEILSGLTRAERVKKPGPPAPRS